MRKSKMLGKWRSGEFARVCSMGHVLPFYINYAAHFGFDGIWIDLEHRAMDQREVQYLLALCRAHDIDAMVRTPTLERTALYRYLEDGAAGLMVPLVSDGATARHLVEFLKFPPLGNRGLDGAAQDAAFGIDAWRPDSTYIEDANRETFIMVQIETLEALKNLDDIAAVDGIDALFLGPADMQLRIDTAADNGGMSMEKAVEQVADAAARHGKAWGIATGSLDALARYREMGAQIVPWGGDFALMNVLKQSSEELDNVLGHNVLGQSTQR